MSNQPKKARKEAGGAIEVEVSIVHFHDCPALGPHTALPRALIADPEGKVVLAYQHKCPFCGQTAGEKQLAKGVTQLADGRYEVNMAVAEQMGADE
jgi:hypothetical protein